MAKFGPGAAKEDLQRILQFKEEIDKAAVATSWSRSVIAAIISRETRGLPSFFVGDNGHGCGPMQIDDRSFPEICAAYKRGEKSNAEMILFGAMVLNKKHGALLTNRYIGTADGLAQAAIAAYNCGEGNVARALERRLPLDAYTTNKNYSSDVLARAAFFYDHFGD